ncbi:acyl-CoA dehydrogenase family protein [Geomesophilobacter sediminis]|uniref:Acyl-CoA dehydrogenase family protein n=1 Tax=Geomesophilobacter sediminis TaxID=2798584 RepID=A0A8J7M083_9BACT|nr:acyl-CoA dehydrogenase family protein [Geomesophilobacter sediminis]MBJ6723837.1 acyl-CoA dehydrogenase family protein [Geomesophilobacter sediminis]
MFKGLDYYDIDKDLNPQSRLVRDTVRDFVEREFIPKVREHYRAGSFPTELIPLMAELGLFGANLTGYELPGLDETSYGLMMQELERGDSGLRSFVSVQGALVMYPIHRFGSEAQKKRWLPPLAHGKAIGCFGLTEPDFGSDPGGMITKAVADGDGYVVSGVKMWITNGSLADVAVVWAKLDGVVRGFLVERGTPGFSANEVTGKMSLRASITSELVLTDARVPKENLLPDAVGLKAALACLNQARYGIAWGAIGAAMACFEEALNYTLERKTFGRAVAGYQLTQEKLVDMATRITTGQLLALQLARLKEEGRLRPAQVSMAKRNNVAMALEVARTTRAMLGANGISDEYQSMRHMCNLESVSTYEGTHDIHTLIIGKDLTGIDALDR